MIGGSLLKETESKHTLNLTKRVWDDVQKIVNEWQNKTFPKSTAKSAMAHLKREIRELSKALKSGGNYREEAADCGLLLLAVCGKKGFSLYDEIERKFAKNQKRKWGKPNKAGFQEHVR